MSRRLAIALQEAAGILASRWGNTSTSGVAAAAGTPAARSTQLCCWQTASTGSHRTFSASASKAAQPTPAATGAAGSSSARSSGASTPFSRWWRDFSAAPTVAKVLGFSGIIPFVALAPPVSKHLTWALPRDMIDNSATWQVGYGASILSFLGAVHWGAAMASPLTGPIAARIAAERLTWSVIPSLAAWPLTLMQPAPASLVLALLLPGAWLADACFARRGFLPAWYMALRTPLTLGATFGVLLTASFYMHTEYDRLEQQQRQQQQQQAGAAAQQGQQA